MCRKGEGVLYAFVCEGIQAIESERESLKWVEGGGAVVVVRYKLQKVQAHI